MGLLFVEPNENKSIQLIFCIVALHISFIAVNVVVAILNTKDNDRKSVISRFMRKRNALEWKKEKIVWEDESED